MYSVAGLYDREEKSLHTYCPEELRLIAIQAVADKKCIDHVISRFENLEASVISFIRHHFKIELLKVVKAKMKERMVELIVRRKMDFINEGKAGLSIKSKFFYLIIEQLTVDGIEPPEEWTIELQNFFHLLMSQFIESGPEEKLKSLIIQWFESGEMSLESRREWTNWFSAGVKLNTLKVIRWPEASRKDVIQGNFLKALNMISTDDFQEKDGFIDVLKLYLQEPRIERDENGTTVNIIGRTIILSSIKITIESIIENNILQVDIFARDVVYIDTDLNGKEWQGKNLCIVAEKVNVWGDRVIDVSGSGHDDRNWKARNGDIGCDGANGKDGRPGESSGNIAIMTKDILNPQKLKLVLNGGNGENGESGGDGGDGIDGKGVTLDELTSACVKYDSLYRTMWNHFVNYEPKNWNRIVCHNDYSNEYLYYEYTDSDKRTMIYSLARYAGWTYSWYELFVWIKGTDGTDGGVGGKNGVGGEGGNQGECIVINPETGVEFIAVNIYKSPGRNGTDGIVGECGKSGNNGNHMAIIDRSASGTNKFFFGEKSNTRLEMKYYVKSDDKRRMNGYRKHVAKESAVFGEFEFEDIPKGGITKPKQKQKQERSTEVQTKMKKSIVLNKLWQKASEHIAQLDGALTAAMATVKSTMNTNFELHESVKEEESTEKQQEVVVVKDVNEDSLEIRRTRAKKSYRKPGEFLNDLLAKKNYESPSGLVQEVITYFLIEFTHADLERASIPMLLRCSRMREVLKNPFKKTLIGAVQDKKEGGLSLTELEHLSKHAPQRRQLKRQMTKYRDDVSDYAKHCQNAKFEINFEMIEKNGKISNVKFVEPASTALWSVNINQKQIVDFTKRLFNDYSFYEVDNNLLLEIHNIRENLKEKMENYLTIFGQNEINWTDEVTWAKFKATLTEEKTEIKAIMKAISTLKQELSSYFEEYTKLIAGTSILQKATNTVHSGSISEIESRFGKVPKFHNAFEKNLEATHFLIRFYYQMGQLVKFNKILMIVNLIYHAETTTTGAIVTELTKNYLNLSLHDLVRRIENTQISLESNLAEQYMREKGFHSAAFRFLVAELEKIKLEIFSHEDYGNVELLESWNPSGERIVRIAFDGHQFHDIVVDFELRQLIEARSNHQWKKYFEDYKQHLSFRSWEYTTTSSKNDFASYFPSGFAASVLEWIDSYVASTADHNFLKMLHERFELDGNHLGIVDFQFLISTAILMQCQYHVSSDFLLNLASSVPQMKLVDTLFIARIESQWRRQLEDAAEISKRLSLISVSHLKILLAAKMNGQTIDEKTLTKLLEMLSFTSTNNKQLEKMNLSDWIVMAEKQKYFTFSHEIKEFANIGYYIIYLKQQDRKEAAILEKILLTKDREFHILEQIIAQVCSLIMHNEIVFDEEYVVGLLALFEQITEHSGLEKTGKHEFICGEREQRDIIEKMKDKSVYKAVITEKPRTLETISELIKGVHDTTNEKHERQKNSKNMAELVKNPTNNDSARYLMKIDAEIKRLFGVHLRDTQKMAIIYAVESEKNILSQVNTGEGKSYIVASIAIIRAKQFKSVDIITSSSVLAQRDAEQMQPLYEAMDLSVAHNCTEGLEDRKQAYKANVVYGEIGRFQRDHLLHDFYRKNILGDRERQSSCVIVDEVDNMLLDNGNNMLYLSHSVPGLELLESLFVHIQRIICSPTVNRGKEEAFSTDCIQSHVLSDLLGRISKEDLNLLALTSIAKNNCEHVWDKLVNLHVIDSDGYLQIQTDDDLLKQKQDLLNILTSVTTELHATKILSAIRAVINRQREIVMPSYLIPFCRRHLREYIESAKRSLFMNPNEAYVVDVDHTGKDIDITPKVTIIDQNTGVDLASSQWSEGLHQCIQIKHACRTSPVSLKAVFVSNVFYLKEYARINGLSGTLGSIEESKTLIELYNTDLIQLPTFRAKKFYEHVPVITQKVDDWIDAIHEEIADQVTVKRSVLVICRTIADVMKVRNGLLERCLKDTRILNTVKICYDNMIVYQREFDEFDFSGENKLKAGRLILATNLAGRGTDIILSDELRAAGGLHVIVSFLPENSRIEDQAYGRAARCGDPGSGQIIAITDKIDATGKPPSVFELKIFRDNAEVQRLQSMTHYYNFHTKIEENCLAAFKQHCLKALRKTSEKNSDSDVPTREEIIYFALLDEWALWLDSQEAAIKECAQERSAAKRGEIIASVQAFLKAHPVEPTEAALRWINAPQPLISLGLIYLDQKSYTDANVIFDSVIKKYPEFTGEACYYKGIIEQQSVRKVKEIPKDIKQSITNKTPDFVIKALSGDFANTTSKAYETTKKVLKDWLPDSVCEIDDVQRIKAEDYLLQAIRTYNQRTENKETLHTIVSRLRKAVHSKTLTSSGFQNQTEELKTTLDCLNSNAYDMIGYPVNWQIFTNMEKTLEEKYESQQQLKQFMEEGYVSPKTLNHHVLPSQCEVLKSKYFFSKRKIQRFFEEQMESSSRVEFYNRTVFLPDEMKKFFKLPRREEFWSFMVIHQCFSTLNEFFIFDQSPGDGLIRELNDLTPVLCPEPHRFRIQLSDFNLCQKVLYDAEQIIKAFQNDKEKLDWLQSVGILTFDASGIVDLDRFNTMTFLPNYDYFTEDELADYLEIDQNECVWIADELVNKGIIRLKLMNLVQINPNRSIIENMKDEEKNLYKTVMNCEQLQKIDNIDEDILRIFLNITKEEAQNIYQEWRKKKILIDVAYRFYLQALDELDCSDLPPCLRGPVSSFLYHKFSYTFAYNALRTCLEASKENPSTKKCIFLPWKPYQSLNNDLIKYGFVHDHKIELRERGFIEDSVLKKIKPIEDKIKSRLFIKSSELMSTKKFFKEEKLQTGEDVQGQVIYTLRQVGKIGENNTWLFWVALKIILTIFMAWSIRGLTLLALDFLINFKSYWSTALLVIAAVGTMLYFIQTIKAKYTTQRNTRNFEERYMLVVNYHDKTVEMSNQRAENKKLANAIVTSIHTKIDQNILLRVPESIYKNLQTILEDPRINTKIVKDLIMDSQDQPYNWKLFRDATREYITLQKPVICAKYYDILHSNRMKCGFRVGNALKVIQEVDKNWTLISSETMNKLLNALLSKLVEDSIIYVNEKLKAECSTSNTEMRKTELSTDSDSNNSTSNYEENTVQRTDFYIDLLYDHARRCVNEEIVAQIGKPLLETFVRYIEHTIESTDAPDGLDNYLAKLTDEKYLIEERGKEVIALRSRFFVFEDLRRAIQQCYSKRPTEQLKQLMNQYNY